MFIYLCFGDFVPGQLDNGEVSFAQCADDFIETDLKGPALRGIGLRPGTALCHDHHGSRLCFYIAEGISVGFD